MRVRRRGAPEPHPARPSFGACNGGGREEPFMTGTREVVIANAPVSYGAFELTVGILPDVPDGEVVLDEVAAAGYAGIALGPGGYFGYGEELKDTLASHGLGLAGGFFELPFSEPAKMPEALLD